MDLISPLGQMAPGWEKDVLNGADGAPDCRRARRNRTLRFARLGAGAFAFCSFHVQTPKLHKCKDSYASSGISTLF
jgi:hypothetical protein